MRTSLESADGPSGGLRRHRRAAGRAAAIDLALQQIDVALELIDAVEQWLDVALLRLRQGGSGTRGQKDERERADDGSPDPHRPDCTQRRRSSALIPGLRLRR